jgi:putative heme-binding domain-containing protein
MKWVLPLLLATSLIGQAARVPWTSNAVKGSPEPPSPYTVERLYPELDIQRPVDLTFAPDSNDLFIATERAQIWHVDTAVSPPTQHLLADMHDHHDPVSNVLGFTFHPVFQLNRYIYINYNEGGSRDQGAHIARFEVTENRPYQLVAESKKVIIQWPSGGHNGCTLAFGPDGYLYFSTGDGAAPDPPDGRFHTGQDISDIMGSIQRIDVDREANGKAYAIPQDNPFVNHQNARPEVWSFGFRNPFRMAFDQRTGELWAGDVGWEQWEMIYLIQRGGNFGWSVTEGPNPKVVENSLRGPGPILPPMASHSHNEAASMTGGQVYYGERLVDLHGAYIYGDWETGRLWALRNEGNKVTSHRELCDTSLKPVSFALDPKGELLILDHNSGIYILTPNSVQDTQLGFPTRLSETGLFASTPDITPAKGTIPYQPMAPMWNDHAQAQWLLGVPGTEAIAQRGGVHDIAGANWHFPTNTVIARTLSLKMDLNNPSTERPIETQLLHWNGQAWNPYTYQWNEEQTDAELVPKTGSSEEITVADKSAPGGIRKINWRFHSRSECQRCHNVWSGEPLTLNPLQLGSGDQSAMEQFVQRGVIESATNRRGRRGRRGPNASLVNPYDSTHPIESRARSWLHVNCGSCHTFGAGGGIAAQFNIDKRLSEARAMDEAPTRGTFDLPDAKVLASGDPHRSAVVYRISTEGAGHMPQIGSRLVDKEGVAIVMEWLSSLSDQNSDSTKTNLIASAKAAVQAPSKDHIKSLLKNTRGSLALMQAGLETTGDSRFRKTTAQLAKAHDNVFVRELFQHWLPANERRKTLGSEIEPAHILALTGDPSRGQELFFGASQCATCHRVNGLGSHFGPDLVQSAIRYNREALLDHILNPSKTVDPTYQAVSITLEDDTEYTGLIREQTEREILLVDSALNEHRIPKAKIFDRFESSLSAMPEGLLAPLTTQEAADLISFLASLKP